MADILYLLSMFGSASAGAILGSLKEYIHKKWVEKKELEEKQIKLQIYFRKRESLIQKTIGNLLIQFRNIAYINIVRLSYDFNLICENIFGKNAYNLAFLKGASMSDNSFRWSDGTLPDLLTEISVLLSNINANYSEEEKKYLIAGFYHIMRSYAIYDFTINPINWRISLRHVMDALVLELNNAIQMLEKVIKIKNI